MTFRRNESMVPHDPDDNADRRRLVDRRDPRTELARVLYDKGLALLDQRDWASARAQLDLARTYEPASPAIAEAIERLEATHNAEEARREAIMQKAVRDAAPPRPPHAGDPDGDEPTVQTTVADMLVAPIRVRTRTWDQAAKLHELIAQRRKLFVRTDREVGVGADVWIEVVLPSEDIALVRAVVRKIVNPGDPSGQPAGLGLEFIGISEDTRAEAARLLGRPDLVGVTGESVDLGTMVDETTQTVAVPPGVDGTEPLS